MTLIELSIENRDRESEASMRGPTIVIRVPRTTKRFLKIHIKQRHFLRNSNKMHFLQKTYNIVIVE